MEGHILSFETPNLDLVLPKVMALSNRIFSPEPESKYASLSLWKQRLSHRSSFIVYLAPIDGAEMDEPQAFLFVHPRVHTPPLSNGQTESLHLWLAGVLPEYRKGGCLQRMVDAVLSGSVLSVCTIPELFPEMWAWLKKRGWTVERELGDGKLLLSMMP